jgi:hypothetical protein
MQQFMAMTSLLASVSSVACISGEEAAEDLVVDQEVLPLIQMSLSRNSFFFPPNDILCAAVDNQQTQAQLDSSFCNLL